MCALAHIAADLNRQFEREKPWRCPSHDCAQAHSKMTEIALHVAILIRMHGRVRAIREIVEITVLSLRTLAARALDLMRASIVAGRRDRSP
jgi:hypothetical protein